MSEKTDTTGGGAEIEQGTSEWHIHRNSTAHGDESVSLGVVEALAEAKGVSPLEIEEPLYEAIDPEALDRLFGPTDGAAAGQVIFTVDGYEVTVTANDDVFVRSLR